MTEPWEQQARVRTRAAIRRFGQPLADLMKRDACTSDTRLLVTRFLHEALGFDGDDDLVTEYADYGVRVGGRLVALVEVKRCAQTLDMRHLWQAQTYAVTEGVAWIILTNGRVWQVYHLTGRLPLILDLAREVDLLSDGSLAQKADGLLPLTKEALTRRPLDQLWRDTNAQALYGR